MAKILSAKEKILSNVRSALLHQTKQPYANLETNDSFYAIENEALEIIFAEAFTAVSGQFVFCENEKECVDTLKELPKRKHPTVVLAGLKADLMTGISPNTSLPALVIYASLMPFQKMITVASPLLWKRR